MDRKTRLLVVRFSSFGDIIQAMSVLSFCHSSSSFDEVDWLTKEQFKGLISSSPLVSETYALAKGEGLIKLVKLAFTLRKKGYTHVYDAHSNLRSRIFCFFFFLLNFKDVQLIRRGKSRIKRILLFQFRKNLFPKPFKGMLSFVGPLGTKVYGRERYYKILESTPDLTHFLAFIDEGTKALIHQNFPVLKSSYIAIAPSAAWTMKTWPIEHWKTLIAGLKNYNIVILGGPEDYFCEDLASENDHVYNLAGKLSLTESSWVVSRSTLLISADTGLLHVADLVGTNALALIGPTAFGFPTNSNVKVLEVDLPCRPCTKDGRGKCSQEIFQRCMVEITPKNVLDGIVKILN